MVKSFWQVAFFLIFFQGQADGAYVDKERLEKEIKGHLQAAFDKMGKKDPSEKDLFTEKEKATLIQDAGIELPTQTFKDQYQKKKDPTKKLEIIEQQYQSLTKEGQKEAASALLKSYSDSPVERQKLVTSLEDVEYTYQLLLKNLSEDDCRRVGGSADPDYVGALGAVDWLNTSHFDSFFKPALADLLVNRVSFNELDSLNQWGLWLEPFGFFTEFRREKDPLKFDLYTAGVSLGGQYTFFDRLILGLGAAYSHSGIQWVENKNTADVNTLYLGPSLNCIFPKGYLGLTLFGGPNFYHVSRHTTLFEKIAKPKHSDINQTTWDVVSRLEGSLTYAPGASFYIYPKAKIDYLYVFQPDFSEQLEEEVELSIRPSGQSFLSSKLGLKITREFFTTSLSFFIPSLSMGGLFYTPLSSPSYEYQLEGCSVFKKKLDISSWNQYYLGTGFTIVHKKGILFSLDYELTLGAESPLQTGSLRLELSW